MQPLLTTLTVAGCFAVLVAYAYGRVHVPPPVHTVAERPTAEPDMAAPTAAAKEVKLFFRRVARDAKASRDAAVIARVYGVTPENMNADIFGGRP